MHSYYLHDGSAGGKKMEAKQHNGNLSGVEEQWRVGGIGRQKESMQENIGQHYAN